MTFSSTTADAQPSASEADSRRCLANSGSAKRKITPPEFKFGSLVRPGHRGIWQEPLRTGKYAINPRCYSVEIVPTFILTLNWADATSTAHNLDKDLKQIVAKSKEGFVFNLDLQVQNFDPVTIGQVVANAGTLRVQGLEGDFTWRSGGFSLRGAAAYNHAQYKDYIGQCYGGQTIAAGCNLLAPPGGAFTSQNYDGRTPPKAPRLAGRLGASYDMPVGNDWTLSLSSDVSYTSSYNFTDTLRPDAVQPGYAKVDASIRLRRPAHELGLGEGDRVLGGLVERLPGGRL